jgi:hypothetical protein
MKISFDRYLVFGSAILAITGFQSAGAQEIDINDGQVLTEADLLAGNFQGNMFQLGPSTVFNINSGGLVAALGSFDGIFDLQGSRFQVASGGALADGSLISNTHINIEFGGEIGQSFQAFGSTVNINGGVTGRSGRFRDQSFVTATNSQLGRDLIIGDRSSLVVQGGSVGLNLDVSGGSSFTIRSGVVGRSIGASSNSVLNIEGGNIGSSGALSSGSTLNMSGGTLGAGFDVSASSVANISGGTVEGMLVHGGSLLNIDGGQFLNGIRARETGRVNLSGGSILGGVLELSQSSTLNMFVNKAWIDGEILDLEQGVSTVITTRGEALFETILSDGSFYSFQLSETGNGNTISENATVRVTLVVPNSATIYALLAGGCFASRRRRSDFGSSAIQD